MMRSFLNIASAIAFCLVSFNAQADDRYTVEQAGMFVQSLGDHALAIISSKNTPKEAKQKKLEQIFATNVDIPWVGRFVVGRFWRQATDVQRTRYQKEYKEFLVEHYTSRFAEYSNGAFKILSSKRDDADQFTVSMEIDLPDGDVPVLVDYRVHVGEDGTLRVYDVIVEGVSMITTQRSEFNAVLTQSGMDGLIQKLDSKSLSASKS